MSSQTPTPNESHQQYRRAWILRQEMARRQAQRNHENLESGKRPVATIPARDHKEGEAF